MSTTRPAGGPAGPHIVFTSHDGYGVGHLRRNSLIARALLDADPTATVTLVTGIPRRPPWLRGDRLDVVHVPPLLKDGTGGYRNPSLSVEDAVAARGRIFADVVRARPPRAVVVDRHPYGTAGELRQGLTAAREGGAALVLGLRDIVDAPATVAAEVAGPGWAGVEDVYDEVLVYGARDFCDHVAEYGVPLEPQYCGWVADVAPPATRDLRLLVVAAGGGGDGSDVFRLGLDLLEHRPSWRAVVAAGPYADADGLTRLAGRSRRQHRFDVAYDTPGCAPLLATAAASVQMAGYNSTFEALAAGIRPILVPRSWPRREQLLRAERLAERGLADVVEPTEGAETVARLLDRRRLLAEGELARAGIDVGGAQTAAARIAALVGQLVTP